MNAFGIDVIQNPQDFLDNNPEYKDQLVDAAQSAFSADGVPTEQDTVEHVLPVSTLVLAYDHEKDEYVGFSSTDRVGDTVYEHGIAVEEGRQRNGLGKAMLSLSILEEMDQEQETVTYRTQSPAMYNCSRQVFNAYPRPEEETPEQIDESLDEVAQALDPDTEVENKVMKSAYPEPMYDGLSDGETKDYLESLGMDYDNGDAILVGGTVTEQEMARAVNQYIGRHSNIGEVNHR